jgi:pyruvate formate lyase activating enzyme
VAFTYNDPVIFHEYAIDVAKACHERGIRTVAVTAGYVCPEPRAEFYAHMDAANVDLKAFTDDFYRRTCAGRLQPVLETLTYLKRATDVWLEVTNLVIPGHNDSDEALDRMTAWVVEHLGPDVPMHFTAFHPDFKMLDAAATPAASLRRARAIALRNGVQHAYTGNVYDPEGSTTWCSNCSAPLIRRDGYAIAAYHLTPGGRCGICDAPCPGVFETAPGRWRGRYRRVRLARQRTPG